ncbi:MAG: tetratricopeptide repeat protein [Pseudomonadales bacterium]
MARRKFHPLLVIGTIALAVWLLFTFVPPPDQLLDSSVITSRRTAMELAADGQYDKALGLLDQLGRQYPEDSSIWTDYVSILHQSGREQEIFTHLTKLNLSLAPIGLIEVLVRSADETAPQSYDLLQSISLSLLPNEPTLARSLGRHLLSIQPARAQELLTEALFKAPDDEEFGLLLAYSQREQPALALTTITVHLKSYPEDERALQLYSGLLMHQAQKGEAQLSWDSLRQQDGNIQDRLSSVSLMLLAWIGDPDQLAAKMTSLDTEQLNTELQQAATALIAVDRPEVARDLYEKGLLLYPDNIAFSLSLVQLLLDQNDLDAARSQLTNTPDSIEKTLVSARLHEQEDDISAALDQLELAAAQLDHHTLHRQWAGLIVKASETASQDEIGLRILNWQKISPLPSRIALELAGLLRKKGMGELASQLALSILVELPEPQQ